MISTKLKFGIVGVVLLAAIGYLMVNSLSTTAEYYLTVGELKSRSATLNGHSVRVAGIVDGNSINRDARAGILRFTAEDATGALPVMYKGAVPDIFGPGIQVVVEGRYGPDGTLEANNVLAQCPSRYEDAVKPPQ